MGRIYANPAFRRIYLRAFKEIANGPMLNANANPILDAKYAAFQASGVTVTAPTAIKTWISTMHNSLIQTLATEGANAAFSITSNSGTDFTTNQNFITISGTAPVEAKTILVNGISLPVTWNSVSSWSIHYDLKAGTNSLQISGIDSQGNVLPGAVQNLNVTYSGQELDPPDGKIVINEIMYPTRRRQGPTTSRYLTIRKQRLSTFLNGS